MSRFTGLARPTPGVTASSDRITVAPGSGLSLTESNYLALDGDLAGAGLVQDEATAAYEVDPLLAGRNLDHVTFTDGGGTQRARLDLDGPGLAGNGLSYDTGTESLQVTPAPSSGIRVVEAGVGLAPTVAGQGLTLQDGVLSLNAGALSTADKTITVAGGAVTAEELDGASFAYGGDPDADPVAEPLARLAAHRTPSFVRQAEGDEPPVLSAVEALRMALEAPAGTIPLVFQVQSNPVAIVFGDADGDGNYPEGTYAFGVHDSAFRLLNFTRDAEATVPTPRWRLAVSVRMPPMTTTEEES